MIALIVFMLAVVGSFAGEGDEAVCQSFIDRNETCQDAVLDTCTTALKAKMLEQIGEVDGLDQKVQEFCNSFITQATGEEALGMCTEKMGAADPGMAEQLKKMQACLAKETCREYADCAVVFE
jgi:hypothetical protein